LALAFEASLVCLCLPTMTQVPPSPIIPIGDEKNPKLYEVEAGITAVPVVEEDIGSSDGDDALRLAGTHAHQFDEEYYLRLRRKIVSRLELKH
jgi:hypothetical protein